MSQTATTENSRSRMRRQYLLGWIVLGGVSIGLAIVLRVFALGIYIIPTSSMEPTLMAGDVVLVSKLRYGIGLPPVVPFTDIVLTLPVRWWWRKPQRGDIIVFRFAYHAQYPSEPDYFVKRIVGMPGDTLWVVGDSLLSRPPRRLRLPPTQQYAGRVIVPAAGMTVSLNVSTIPYWRPFIEREGNKVEVTRNLVLINRQSRSDYTFEQDYYYVLGDNRQRSFDSRWWGFVSAVDIVGSPVLVLWSKSPVLGTMRWERTLVVPQ